ncbi:putative Biotin lipoate A B protein ligase family [Trypanosoma vivax]|uniref:Putative lipoate-protein ligase n=1 Tax=Trypanosoma vivax (strain Y486) TaxID=1055687 RepID=G0U006_TRYVY|nr:putative lipoate-protein ligase [Trypanosoma vivax]KAH8613640.1 putative Biotin lipoate A B protein ligase family [Trypanosoma vivax]CCC49402.1 putative lipoate-protein ligase [Trypanosoma vivax Y486]
MRCSYGCLFPVVSLASFVARHAALTRHDRLLTTERKNVVLISNSHNIYENLATEEAMLRGVVLGKDQRFLFMYVNEPCVVVGRNQNLRTEVAIRAARRDGITIARRNSGGGAVYHDRGNVCLAVFTHRDSYCPDRSVKLLRMFLNSEFGVALERQTTTNRHDLFLDGMKITGSAMRVQRDIAYHHFTLLVSSCPEKLGVYLKQEGDYVSFTTSAVGSVRSPVTTLQGAGVFPAEYNSERVVDHVLEAKAKFFIKHADEVWGRGDACTPCGVEAPTYEAAAAPCSFVSNNPAGSVMLVDVVGAVERDIKFIDGENRRAASDASQSMRTECNRLSAAEWLFCAPKFETRISITAKELLARNSSVTQGGGVSEQIVAYCMEAHTRIDITTVVENHCIASLSAFWVDNGAVVDGEKPWCLELLQRILLGEHVNNESSNICEKIHPLLAENLGFVEDGAGECMGDNTEKCTRLNRLLFMEAVLDIWCGKNVFRLTSN